MFIDNRQNVFPGISGAEWVNIILWKLDYANNLNGYQLVFTNGTDPSKELLPLEVSNIEKPIEIIELGKLVEQNKNFTSMTKIISSNKPYGLRKNVFTKFKQFNLPQMETKKILDGFTIYGSNKEVRYVDSSYPLPKLTNAFKKYKVFVPSAWGNMSKKTGFGGAWSDIIIGKPFDCCTETFIEIGAFDSIELAKFQAKYILTKFVRALIYVNKISQQCSKQVWKNVPIQDFKEEWWNLPIESIDKHLFEKYSIPNNIQNFVLKNFQKKCETNIVNFVD